MQHDDGAIVWVNGHEVHAFEEPRAVYEKPLAFPVRLRQGLNHILIKIDQLGGHWGFNLSVRPVEGKPFPVVHVRESP